MIVNSNLREKAERIEMTPFEYVKKVGEIEQEKRRGQRKVDNKHLYSKDIVTLKLYGDRLKLTMCKTVRKKGYEGGEKMKRGTANKKKLDNNISRSKAKIFEYAMCNEWDYFVTLTIDQKKFDRYNLESYYKDFSKYIQNKNRYLEDKIKYIFIPELHEDGAWHMHGLIKGVPEKDIGINDYGYLEWQDYADRYGYISMMKIKDKQKCASYITKYVTKGMSNTMDSLNAQSYYCSKGLKKAIEIKKGRLCESLQDLSYDYANEYVKIKWFDSDISIAEFIDEIKE